MICLSYILQVTSSFSGKGQIEEDPANTEGVKLKRLTSIENSFESSVSSNILFLQMTLLKELQAFCPSLILPRSRLGNEVVEQAGARSNMPSSRGWRAPSASPLQGSQAAGKQGWGRGVGGGVLPEGTWALGICSLPGVQLEYISSS